MIDKPQTDRFLEFVHTKLFERSAKGLLSETELRDVEMSLIRNPRAGAVEHGTGGVRKMRVGMPGTGKRGGARVVYFYVARRRRIYLLFTFPKNRQESLTNEQREAVRRLATQLKAE